MASTRFGEGADARVVKLCIPVDYITSIIRMTKHPYKRLGHGHVYALYIPSKRDVFTVV